MQCYKLMFGAGKIGWKLGCFFYTQLTLVWLPTFHMLTSALPEMIPEYKGMNNDWALLGEAPNLKNFLD